MKAGVVGYITLLYQETERLSAGIENMWDEHKTKNSNFCQANRLQTMVKFDF